MTDYIGHKKIHRFELNGSIHDESDIPRLKVEYEKLIDKYINSKGYVRVLDIDPVFTIEYNGKNFLFIISMYGIYVGKARSKCYQGVAGHKLIPVISTQKTKSNQSSIHVEQP